MVSSVPIGTVFLVTPMRINWFGLPPSISHSVTLPSGSFTATWNHECGLTISHLISDPFKVSGLFTSNSAANAWCARTWAATSNTAAQAITTTSFARMSVRPLLCLLGLRLFLGARAGEDVGNSVVGLVARELEDRSLHLRERRFGGP